MLINYIIAKSCIFSLQDGFFKKKKVIYFSRGSIIMIKIYEMDTHEAPFFGIGGTIDFNLINQ